MKGNFEFVAERALAKHSAALVRAGPADTDLLAAFGTASTRLAKSLRGALARLCGVEQLDVAIAAPREVAFADFASERLCAYSLYGTGTVGERLISAIDAEAVLRLIDRAFGGPGDAPRTMPTELPVSADLMLARIEAILAVQLGLALGGSTAIQPLRRDTDLNQLQPFARSTRLAVIDIAISDGARAPWPIRFALPLAALPTLTGIAGLPMAARPRGPASDPAREPFAAMPMHLTALLVDTRVPLHVITRLEPGQVLSLPIARQVPLIAGRHGVGKSGGKSADPSGGQAIGHGTIGAMDDHVAIQMTQLS